MHQSLMDNQMYSILIAYDSKLNQKGRLYLY